MYVCTFISCQKGRQIILKSICLLKSCGKNNNIARADGSSTALCGFPYPPVRFSWLVHRAPAPSPSAALAQCLDLAWLGLAWLKALNTNRGTFQCGCAPLDSIAHEQRKVMLRFMHETWRVADTLPLPAAEVPHGREREGEMAGCTAAQQEMLSIAVAYIYFCAERAAFDWWIFKDCQLTGKS